MEDVQLKLFLLVTTHRYSSQYKTKRKTYERLFWYKPFTPSHYLKLERRTL